jgi:raffinose/stachyose/melibiose transport system permease protein
MIAGRGRIGRRWAAEVAMVAFAIVYFFPAYVFLTVSMKTPAEVAESPFALPEALRFDNYRDAWREGDLGSAMVSSVVVTSLSVALLVTLGSAAAYVLARRTSRMSHTMFIVFLLGLMIPTQIGMVPLYELVNDAGLLQTWTGLIVVHVGQQLPFTIFLYAGFIRALPKEYEEAGYVDGASPFRAFRSVVFPLLRPVTGTVIILTGVHIWNEFLVPLLYVGGSPQQTLPVAVFQFRGEYATQWDMVFAGMAIAIVPILLVFFLLQRQMIRGFAGGLRG